MHQCIAFVTDPNSRNAWRPCKNRAHRRQAFCKHHEKAFAGIMLGIWAHDLVDPRKDLKRHHLRHMPVASQRPS